MRYSIGEVAKKFVRNYDKEGLIPQLEKNESGNRMFEDEAISGLFTIE